MAVESIWDPKQTLEEIGLGRERREVQGGKRSDKVGRTILQELSTLLVEKVSDPRLQSVSISRVEVTGDLGLAKIFYTVQGGKKAVSEAAKGFKRAAGFMRSHIAHTINLRFTPVLQFHYDHTAEKVAELEEIFQEIAEERKKTEQKAELSDNIAESANE